VLFRSFSIDTGQDGDRIFAGAGEDVQALIMEVVEATDGDGKALLRGTRDIILSGQVGD